MLGKSKFFLVSLCILLALTLCSCKNSTKQTDTKLPDGVSDGADVNGGKNNAADDQNVKNDTDSDKKDQDQNKVPEFINPISGLECTKEIYENRPVAVMLNNIKQAMPQVGISHADIIYEVLEEGGITRLMGVFKDYKDIAELGSIRSSRDYYIDLSDAHDAIYVHCGGSTYAKAMLKERKTEDIDGLYVNNFYRSKSRAKTMAYEHTLMISGEGLTNAIADKGYRTTSDKAQPLKFSADYKKGETDAVNIKVPFSLALSQNPYALSTFAFDKDKNAYLKGQYDTTHIDGETGEQLCFDNVITLECKQNVIPGDAYHCLAVNFTGEGKGLYAADGKIREITWKKASRTEKYTLYESDGVTELVLKPGKTYIGIVPTGTEVSYS